MGRRIVTKAAARAPPFAKLLKNNKDRDIILSPLKWSQHLGLLDMLRWVLKICDRIMQVESNENGKMSLLKLFLSCPAGV